MGEGGNRYCLGFPSATGEITLKDWLIDPMKVGRHRWNVPERGNARTQSLRNSKVQSAQAMAMEGFSY